MNRRIILNSEEVYHIFNRGVDKRELFPNARYYKRAFIAANFYQFTDLPCKLSDFLEWPIREQEKFYITNSARLVEIIAYCLMPNHFHFILKQITDNGISDFIANFCNSYGKYFNTKNERSGHLFQGRFKGVHVESDQQLVNLSRYIHMNPVSSSLISINDLSDYSWSSYPEYLDKTGIKICKPDLVLSQFQSVQQYETFVLDHVDYLKTLEGMKFLDFG